MPLKRGSSRKVISANIRTEVRAGPMTVLRHRDYQGAVEFDDGRLIIRILHIDDFITTEVDSASQAQSAFAELVDDYVISCAELGKEPCKPLSAAEAGGCDCDE